MASGLTALGLPTPRGRSGCRPPHGIRRPRGKLGTPPHVAEKCLNHSLGRIVATYDKDDMLEPRRVALAKWEAFVLRLVSPKSTNVVPFPQAATA